ncbi:fibronectin type III domain-containing protein [Niabella yanshanensis]|uniref:Fibronectin type III domain-containing protein n=1 Tax=Niabella yanshanensis TaxID=577386 RepID=A0ABZ0W401_9BACT|nr:fibronectin type III domain-containing protein [Niabella yanshanensis]WQD37998.1 fibronectin type III domain-containing protein [Niabella yanshanensis]
MAVIQLLPGGAGGVSFSGQLIAPVNNRLLAIVSVANYISLTIEGYIVAHPYLYTDFRDKTGVSFNSATEVVEYIQYNFVEGSAMQKLAKPELTIGAITQSSIEAEWTNVASAQNYVLQYSTGSGFDNAVTAYTGADLSDVIEGLNAQTFYNIRVKAIADGYTDSDWAIQMNIETLEGEDALSLGTTTALYQVLNWLPVSGAYVYQLRRSATSSMAVYETLYTGKELTYKDNTVMPGSDNYYQVVPMAANTTFSPSNILLADIPNLTGNVYEVGTSTPGTHQVPIDGADFWPNGASAPVTLQPGDTIEIISNNYYIIDVKNINIAGDLPLLIRPKVPGGVIFDGQGYTLVLDALDNVRVTGIQFANNPLNCVEVKSALHNVILDHLTFNNINEGIRWTNTLGSIVYNPSDPTTYCSNVQISHIIANNVGQVVNTSYTAGIAGGSITGLVRDLTFSSCSVINAPEAGAVLSLSCVDNAKVHDNYFENINLDLTNHTCICLFKGPGQWFSNKAKNVQGQMVRFWPSKYSSAIAGLLVYNNIHYNTPMYGMFEIQVVEADYTSPAFIPIDGALFENNSGGLFNTTNYSFAGRFLDIYDKAYYGDLIVNHNLMFANQDDQWYQLGLPDSETGNEYFATAALAVDNTTDFHSLHTGTGASL